MTVMGRTELKSSPKQCLCSTARSVLPEAIRTPFSASLDFHQMSPPGTSESDAGTYSLIFVIIEGRNKIQSFFLSRSLAVTFVNFGTQGEILMVSVKIL